MRRFWSLLLWRLRGAGRRVGLKVPEPAGQLEPLDKDVVTLLELFRG